MPATALDIITGALKRINVLAAGETLDNLSSQDALIVLNDLLDSLSNEHLACYQRVENILNFTSGQGTYTIGTPQGGTFLGIVTNGSNIITGVTAMPSGIVVGGAVTGNGIPAGATITAIGSNTVTLSAAAIGTFPLSSFTFTTPGNFAV